MSLFQVEEQKNEHRERAKAMLLFANQVSEEIKRLYDMGREMMWSVPGYKVEDAQKILNELRLLVPPSIDGETVRYGGDIQLFTYHGALGTFLSSIGVIKPEEVASPVSYTLADGSIVLTGDRYPTEPLPEEESEENEEIQENREDINEWPIDEEVNDEQQDGRDNADISGPSSNI
jgi:hypothetical protein